MQERLRKKAAKEAFQGETSILDTSTPHPFCLAASTRRHAASSSPLLRSGVERGPGPQRLRIALVCVLEAARSYLCDGCVSGGAAMLAESPLVQVRGQRARVRTVNCELSV